jgi:formamidopyrimidine-DNA glycosylase
VPELPDIEVYLTALKGRVVGQRLVGLRLASPFLLRTVTPSLPSFFGQTVTGVRRIGKRIVFAFEAERFLVVHLMIAGRLHWKPAGAKLPGRIGAAAFDFARGTLTLTEAGTKKRASLHAVEGAAALGALDPGGIDVLTADLDQFVAALTRERHTLKRALTDPHLFSGIGNAYSDEMLHDARLSPFLMSDRLSAEERARLHGATQRVLRLWIARLHAEAGEDFPAHVTAFRPAMAVHGRHREPCPVCGTAVQRIVHAEHEANYCPTCQTGGKILADRSLSRLLKADWPRTVDELERKRH